MTYVSRESLISRLRQFEAKPDVAVWYDIVGLTWRFTSTNAQEHAAEIREALASNPKLERFELESCT